MADNSIIGPRLPAPLRRRLTILLATLVAIVAVLAGFMLGIAHYSSPVAGVLPSAINAASTSARARS